MTIVSTRSGMYSMWNDLRNRTLRPIRMLHGRALKAVLILGLIAPLVQGCGAILVGGVAATGAAILHVHDRRNSRTILEDERTEHLARRLLRGNPDIKAHSRIAITSYNHLVLLTGQAETQSISDRFARKVARLPKVKKVVNEVTVGPPVGFARSSEDALITSRVKLALTKVGLPCFDATRVKVVTEASDVFLMGLVRPGEGNAAAEKARYVPGVTKVVKLFEYIQP